MLITVRPETRRRPGRQPAGDPSATASGFASGPPTPVFAPVDEYPQTPVASFADEQLPLSRQEIDPLLLQASTAFCEAQVAAAAARQEFEALVARNQAYRQECGWPQSHLVDAPSDRPEELASAALRTTPEVEASWRRELEETATPLGSPMPVDRPDHIDSHDRCSSDHQHPGTSDTGPFTPSPAPSCPPSPVPVAFHAPSATEILEWSQRLMAPSLLIFVAHRHWPPSWIVEPKSAAEKRLHRLVVLRLTEGSQPWPTLSCKRCKRLDTP